MKTHMIPHRLRLVVSEDDSVGDVVNVYIQGLNGDNPVKYSIIDIDGKIADLEYTDNRFTVLMRKSYLEGLNEDEDKVFLHKGPEVSAHTIVWRDGEYVGIGPRKATAYM